MVHFTKIAVPAAVFLLILILESAAPFFHFEVSRLKHGIRNISIFFLNTLLLYLLFSVGAASLLTHFNESHQGLLNFLQLDGFARLATALILFDFWMYIWHRMTHEIPFIWRFHRMHHSDPAMDITTATRFHIGELIISSCLRIGVMILLGMGMMELLIYETLMMPAIYFHHSNYALPAPVDRILRLIIVTPRMHWVHHSRIRRETDSNYGTVFSFWDRLAGTFRLRKDPENIVYGVDGLEGEKFQTMSGMLKTPFVTIPAANPAEQAETSR